jgi:TolB-like protein
MATRQLAAIMFTDLVGYTAMMQENETLAVEVKDRSRKIFDESLTAHAGKLLQNYGDGTLSIFSSALDAVQCAVKIQTLNRQGKKIEMRIGLHLGDVMFDETGIYGDSVNVASRIESLATPGAVFISEKLFEEIKNQNIEARPLGFFELKNVRQPMNVFAVAATGLAVPSRDEVKGKVKQSLNSIAVLPFSSLSSDPENEFFCDGITEELLNVLAKMDGLQVTSRTSSFAFKGKNEDVRELAAKLNVQKILEGSVRKSGNRVRITAQLINAADGYHLWSETYDRSLEDIFAVQDDIAREIANKFKLNLNEADHAKEMVQAPTENMEAYKKFLEGVYLWNTQDPANIQRCIESLNEATRLDESFTAPYSYLAFVYFFLYYSGAMPQTESSALCLACGEAALKRDPESDQSQLAYGISCFANFEWEKSRTYIQQSVNKNPNSTLGWISLASYYAFVLDKKKCFECLEKARVIDPIGPFTIGSLVEFHVVYGQFEEAIKIANEFTSLAGPNPYVETFSKMAAGFQGNWNELIAWMEQGLTQIGDFPIGLVMLGIAYCKTGQPEKGDELIEVLKQQEAATPGLIIEQIGVLYGNMMRKDEFFERLRLSIQHRLPGMLWYYKTSFYPAEISNDIRFVEIRNQAGLPI